ncbi:MAG: tRNA uridine-5-carboxymethylaminomethyl(34) synthesis GTPase MnmE [Clostridia bacterium]|nr:tRNA uridine-5-carboxymethylaminomethyl(34) synthesis GTPase MnmE [Clostridia bacterium]
MSTTIAAISTPQGEGGIGTVRLSGENAAQIADRVFTSVSGKKIADAKGYTALLGKVGNGDGDIDEAVALIFVAPKSYTGENVVELSVHGGATVTRLLLRAVLDAGAVPAGAGEFTRRAYENGKLDLAAAESVMSIISAQGGQDLRLALAAKTGRISSEIAKIREKLLAVDAGMSVFADYPDEDLPEFDPETIRESLSLVVDSLDTLLKNYDKGKILREGLSVAIIGAPNVGKSTLMNLLSGDNRSIVTPIAGTTRDIIEESVRVGDLTLRLADTAGVRETGDAVEEIGVTLACERAKSAELILAVFDSSREMSEDDRKILALIGEGPAIAVINKTDLPQKLDDREIALEKVYISAKKGDDSALAAKIAEVVGTAELGADRAVLQSERQRACAYRARQSVLEALDTLDSGYTLDAVGICADEALSALLELTGERVTDAVADEVFSRFCVGK